MKAVKNQRVKPRKRTAADGVYVSPFWQRTLAFVIDLIPLVLLAVVSATGLGFLDPDRIPVDPRWGLLDQVADVFHDQGPGLIRSLLVGMGIAWAYGWLTEWLFQGTPGNKIVGTRVIDQYGERPGPGRLFLRNGAKMLSFLGLGLGGIWAAFDGERRTLHDRLSGTYVIRASED